MTSPDPLGLLRGLAEARQRFESQLEQLNAVVGPQVRRGKYCEVERGIDGELVRITVLASGPGSAIMGEARELWAQLAADAAQTAQQGLEAIGIQPNIALPADIRSIVEERR